MRDLKGKPLK